MLHQSFVLLVPLFGLQQRNQLPIHCSVPKMPVELPVLCMIASVHRLLRVFCLARQSDYSATSSCRVSEYLAHLHKCPWSAIPSQTDPFFLPTRKDYPLAFLQVLHSLRLSLVLIQNFFSVHQLCRRFLALRPRYSLHLQATGGLCPALVSKHQLSL